MTTIVIFNERGRKGDLCARIDGKVAFPARGQPQPKKGDEWEVEVVGTNPAGSVLFVRLVRLVSTEEDRWRQNNANRWRAETLIRAASRQLKEEGPHLIAALAEHDGKLPWRGGLVTPLGRNPAVSSVQATAEGLVLQLEHQILHAELPEIEAIPGWFCRLVRAAVDAVITLPWERVISGKLDIGVPEKGAVLHLNLRGLGYWSLNLTRWTVVRGCQIVARPHIRTAYVVQRRMAAEFPGGHAVEWIDPRVVAVVETNGDIVDRRAQFQPPLEADLAEVREELERLSAAIRQRNQALPDGMWLVTEEYTLLIARDGLPGYAVLPRSGDQAPLYLIDQRLVEALRHHGRFGLQPPTGMTTREPTADERAALAAENPAWRRAHGVPWDPDVAAAAIQRIVAERRWDVYHEMFQSRVIGD